MKKTKFILICSGALVLILIAGVLIGRIKNNKRDSDDADEAIILNEAENAEADESQDMNISDASGNNGDEDENGKMDVFSIPGYINGADESAEQMICGVQFPYSVLDTPIIIEGMGQYSGPFVEDGSDKPVANVLAIVVKNDSDTVVEFAELRFAVNDTEEAVFKLSTIPAGKEAVVLEQNGREYHAEDRMNLTDKLYAKKDSLPLMESEVKITAEDGVLTVENLTEKSLGTVYVRYKTKINDQYYLGGITYSCKVENVDAGAGIEAKTKHFSADGSQVLMVEAVQEN